MAVRVPTSSHKSTTAKEKICGRGTEGISNVRDRQFSGRNGQMHTIVRTLKNRLGSSSPIVLVLRAKTPIGKVNPHQPYNRLVLAGSLYRGGGQVLPY